MSDLMTYKEFEVKSLGNKSYGVTFRMLQNLIQFGQPGRFGP